MWSMDNYTYYYNAKCT